MSITYNKEEIKYGKQRGTIWHFSSFIVLAFLALLLYPPASQAKPAAADSLRIIYGGNLIDPGQKQSYFLPYLVIRKNGKRILITSILDPAYLNYLRRDKLKITDPVATLNRLKKDISHDLFIVIGHAKRKNILTWIDQIQGIDLLIQGHQPGISRQAKKYKNTTIVINNIRGGQYTTHIDVSWTPANKVIISQPVAIKANARQTMQDPQISRLINDYEKWRREFLQQQTCPRPENTNFQAGDHADLSPLPHPKHGSGVQF